MLPLIPFAIGLVTGAAAIRLLRGQQARNGLEQVRSSIDKAQETLREAAVSSLNAIETSSARARKRLATETPAAEPPTAPARKKRTPRKNTVTTAANAAPAAATAGTAAPRKRRAKAAKAGTEPTA